MNDDDPRFMRRAIELGEEVKGRTGDNPWVGCVIVRKGNIIGEGATQPPGEAHAEAAALSAAKMGGDDPRDATLYCTVEPCSFQGRTPSCARAIVSSGIARVVIAIRDPHPRVNGEGIRILETAGISVCESVCEDEVRASLRHWLKGYGL